MSEELCVCVCVKNCHWCSVASFWGGKENNGRVSTHLRDETKKQALPLSRLSPSTPCCDAAHRAACGSPGCRVDIGCVLVFWAGRGERRNDVFGGRLDAVCLA